jgi:MbtH protein
VDNFETIMNDKDGTTRYSIVENYEGQCSLWPIDRELPPGWSRVGGAASRQACLDQIEAIWKDIRPRSILASRSEAAHAQKDRTSAD